MAHHIFRKGGIPALASLHHDVSSPALCTLDLMHVQSRQQATFVLQFKVLIHGFDGEQPVRLVYGADNLIMGLTALGPPNGGPLPPALIGQIVRNNDRGVRMLSLHLKSPCAVHCPRSTDSLSTQNDHPDARFTQLVRLAQATRLHILFDYAWLNPTSNKAARFLDIIAHPEDFSALRLEPHHFGNSLRETDWTAFSPLVDVATEAVPVYNDTFHKRRREATSPRSSSPNTPKRQQLLTAPSPTEVATPSPKSWRSAPDFQDAVNYSVVKVLPDLLQTILPGLLSSLKGSPRSSPPPHQSTSSGREDVSSFDNSPAKRGDGTVSNLPIDVATPPAYEGSMHKHGRKDVFLDIIKHPHQHTPFYAKEHSVNILQDAASELPPTYDATTHKRTRGDKNPPNVPTPKRLQLFDVAPSPTELATPTPKPSSPSVRDALSWADSALMKVLPGMLQDMLPGMLATLFANARATSSSSQTESATPKAPLASLQDKIRDQLTDHVDALSKELTEQFEEHMADLRDATQVDFEEDLKDHSLNIELLKEDGLHDINQQFDAMEADLKGRAEDIIGEVVEELDDVYDAARKNMAKGVAAAKEDFVKKLEEFQEERKRVKKQLKKYPIGRRNSF